MSAFCPASHRFYTGRSGLTLGREQTTNRRGAARYKPHPKYDVPEAQTGSSVMILASRLLLFRYPIHVNAKRIGDANLNPVCWEFEPELGRGGVSVHVVDEVSGAVPD